MNKNTVMGNTYFSRCSCGFLCFQFYFRRMVLKFQNMKRSPFHKGVRQTNVVVLTFVFMQVSKRYFLLQFGGVH